MTPEELRGLVQPVADKRNADVLIYSGGLQSPSDDTVIEQCRGRRRRPNVLLVLTTMGGQAHAAYRIARCLRRHYAKVSILIAGYCKSAGTLLVLGADELVMNEYAELGPLDVQVPKADEYEHGSGLTPAQALALLDGKVLSAFKSHFLELKFGLAMTTRTAAEFAARLASNAYSNVYAQIDPMRVAEMERALTIAKAYGERLGKDSRNAKRDTLGKLIAGYPSHDFVIDRDEARSLFENVADPTSEEEGLVNALNFMTRAPIQGSQVPVIMYLNPEDGVSDASSTPRSEPASGSGTPDSSSPTGEDSGVGTSDGSDAPGDVSTRARAKRNVGSGRKEARA